MRNVHWDNKVYKEKKKKKQQKALTGSNWATPSMRQKDKLTGTKEGELGKVDERHARQGGEVWAHAEVGGVVDASAVDQVGQLREVLQGRRWQVVVVHMRVVVQQLLGCKVDQRKLCSLFFLRIHISKCFYYLSF